MKAKRGDIAVIVTERRDYYIGQESVTRTEVTVHVVTSITREGIVKAVRDAAWGSTMSHPINRYPYARRSALYVVPATEFDVPAIETATRARTYPNSTTPMAYGSVDEVKTMLRTHRIACPV